MALPLLSLKVMCALLYVGSFGWQLWKLMVSQAISFSKCSYEGSVSKANLSVWNFLLTQLYYFHVQN